MLVMGESGRVLASVPLLGHLPATAILADAPKAAEYLPALASGERRAAYLPAQPPSDIDARWSADPTHGMERPSPATGSAPDDKGEVTLSGGYGFVPDAPGADVLVGVAIVDGEPAGVAIMADGDGVTIEPVRRYDATRSLGHVTLKDAPATVLDAPGGVAGRRLVPGAGADRGRVARQCRDGARHAPSPTPRSATRSGARSAPTRRSSTRSPRCCASWRTGARCSTTRAGRATARPAEFPLAASAARSVAGRALDHGARTMISVHGGIGATWEHDAPLYFRRAQLSRRLLGGTAGATDRVAGELIAQARRRLTVVRSRFSDLRRLAGLTRGRWRLPRMPPPGAP